MIDVPADENGPLLVRVFKTTADPFVGRLTYLRVLSGTLHSQAHVWNATRGEDERIGQLLLLHGKEQEPIGELKAGEIGAVAKLTVTETGDTLSLQARPLVLAALEFPEPALVLAIEPQSKGDLDKMGPALARMLEEEPTVRLERSDTGEQVLRTMGEAHTSVIIERLKRKFGAAIVTHIPRVPYKETIRGKTQVHGRYKKQTGGHGMFGDVWLELEPNPDGGVEFAERVVGGSVPKGFFAGVEKGIREAAEGGVLAGYPLSDFRATLYDGSFHPVDSNEMAFKIAASIALKDGVQQAKPALLEPIMTVEIRIPEAYMGEVNRDLNGRRGRVLGMDSDGDTQVIKANVPLAEMANYATELRSLAQGRGSFTMTLDHYEDVPGHIAEKVIETHRKEVEAAGGHSGGH
jgi:elongation factor G